MWLLYLLLGLLVLVALVFVVGALLPPRTTGRYVATLDREPRAVWDALEDVEAHPMTGRAMRSVERLPEEDGRPAWREDMGHGELITVRTLEREPPRRLVREMAARAVNMDSIWTYDLEPVDGGTRVSVEGVTHIRRGTWHTPVFRVMMRVGGGVRAGLRIQLAMVAETLGARLDAQG